MKKTIISTAIMSLIIAGLVVGVKQASAKKKDCTIKNAVAGAESNDSVIIDGVLRSYSGEDTVYKVPKKVKKIDYKAFENAENLKKVIIGSNVKNIVSSFVYGNNSITSIVVSKDNKKYSSHNGLLYNKSGKKMIACAPARKNVVIYDKCEKPGLIEGDNIETITIGKKLNDYYVNVLDRTFIGATPKLKKITVKKKNKKYYVKDGVLFMKSDYTDQKNNASLVKYPSAVQADKYVIPDEVSSIMPYAFSCSTIGNLIISENVTSINNPMYHANIENITCRVNSTAHKYAADNNMNWQELK